MKKEIPVIFIHRGCQSCFYLPYTIKQALKNNTVYLIGDADPKIPELNFVNFSELTYQRNYQMFKSVYTPLGGNDTELFWIERWFILLSFMNQQKLDLVFYVDSDVMLYVDVNKEWPKFNQYDMTVVHRLAATSSFITLKAIKNLCTTFIRMYNDKNGYYYYKLVGHYNAHKQSGVPGSVCDMTIIDLFHSSEDIGGGPGCIGEMMTVINDSTYDHMIYGSNGIYETDESGFKKIKFKEKIPYVYHNNLKKDIKFNCLHFQGPTKNRIPQIFELS
jgi:hypothetical protein